MRTRVAVAVLSIAAAVFIPAGASQAAEPQPDTAYLVGTTLHLPDGRVERLPIRDRFAPTTDLLGHTSRGWVLGVGRRFVAYADGEITRLGPRPFDETYTSELLSSDRRQIVTAVSGQADDLTVRLVSVRGKVRDLPGTVNTDAPSDAMGRTAYVVGTRGIDQLTAGERRHRLTRKPAELVDLRHGVAFHHTTESGAMSGPSPFDPDGEPAVTEPTWTARFHPVKVSAHGKRVLGYLADGRVQVRRMSDGRPLRTLDAPDHDELSDVIGWDGPDGTKVLLVVAVSATRHALARCAVASGECVQVTRPTTAAITLPTTVAGVRSYP